MANCEGSYEKTFADFQAKAKQVSDKYEADHPNCAIKNKYYDPSYRKQDYKSYNKEWDVRPCPRCSGSDVESKEVVAGCRMDGDGYGSTLRWCQTCGLFDYCSYDEA